MGLTAGRVQASNGSEEVHSSEGIHIERTSRSISRSHHHESVQDATPTTIVLVEKVQWIQDAVDRWYVLYQPTFPLLDDLFHADLDIIDPLLREALLLAMYSIVYRSRTERKEDAMLSSTLLDQFNYKKRSDPVSILNRLTCLQVTMMLAIEADQRGYVVASSIHTVGHWLGQATAQAYDLRLHHDNIVNMSTTEELILGRRLYLVLIILDRWHSVSTSSPPFITDNNTRFDIDLQLSGITDHLYRLSIILGHVYAYTLAPHGLDSIASTTRRNDSCANFTETAIRTLKAEIEEWRNGVDVIWGQSNLLHIAYWHVCILSMLSSTTFTHMEILELRDVAMRLASTSTSAATPFTPLNHHFYTLTTCVLSHLLEFDETHDDALRGLASLAEAVERHRDLVDEDASSWDAKLLETSGRLRDIRRPYEQHSNQAAARSLLDSVRKRGYLLSIDLIG